MFRLLLFIFLLVSTNSSKADAICTLVYDVDKSTFLLKDGSCDQLISPASTFKIPLSLMGYDSGYLTSLDLPELPFRADYPVSLASHKHETSPAYWMKNSVVWFSQVLTEWLGMKRLINYVDAFDYGNKDLSGDPGMNNGLTRAWLSSSLKITPLQQLAFLQKLLNRELPVKEEAYEFTERLLKQDAAVDTYDVYGKTGSVVSPVDKNNVKQGDRQYGWFIGWVRKHDKNIIFVNVVNEPKQEGVFSGPKAKADILGRLTILLPKYD
jgi:beta-lactamase class D